VQEFEKLMLELQECRCQMKHGEIPEGIHASSILCGTVSLANHFNFICQSRNPHTVPELAVDPGEEKDELFEKVSR